jgi:hypothetical protein
MGGDSLLAFFEYQANGVTINAGPLLTIPPAIHSLYFFDPNGIRLEIVSDLDGEGEDLQSSDPAA